MNWNIVVLLIISMEVAYIFLKLINWIENYEPKTTNSTKILPMEGFQMDSNKQNSYLKRESQYLKVKLACIQDFGILLSEYFANTGDEDSKFYHLSCLYDKAVEIDQILNENQKRYMIEDNNFSFVRQVLTLMESEHTEVDVINFHQVEKVDYDQWSWLCPQGRIDNLPGRPDWKICPVCKKKLAGPVSTHIVFFEEPLFTHLGEGGRPFGSGSKFVGGNFRKVSKQKQKLDMLGNNIRDYEYLDRDYRSYQEEKADQPRKKSE